MNIVEMYVNSARQVWDSFLHNIEFLKKRKVHQRFISIEELKQTSPVFVLSTGRAGTKLLTTILKKSPNLWVEHEPAPSLAHHSSLIYQANMSKNELEWSVIHSRLHIMTKIFKAGLRYVETNNRISLYAPAISTLFPKSKFIHLIRHPADFVRSGMRRGYYDSLSPEQSGHLEPRPSDSLNEHWKQLTRVEKISWQWNETNRQIELFKESINSDRVCFIRSDELFSSVETHNKITSFIGVEPININILNKYIRKKVNKQTSGSYPHYIDWTTNEKNAFKQIVSLAEKYGFEI